MFGIVIYINRQTIAPIVQDTVRDAIRDGENWAATAFASEPTPTKDYTDHILLGNNYWDIGALNEALSVYMRIADLFPNTPELYRRIALGLINQNRPDEALMFSEKAINADPFSSDAWAMHAWTLDWNNRAAESLANSVHALELNPANSRAKAYLAEAYLSLGQLESTRTILQEAFELDPNSPELYRARGLMKWEGEFDRPGAIEDFATAYAMTPNMHFIAIDIATLEMGLGNFGSARELLEMVLQADPENELAPVQLVALYQ